MLEGLCWRVGISWLVLEGLSSGWVVSIVLLLLVILYHCNDSTLLHPHKLACHTQRRYSNANLILLLPPSPLSILLNHRKIHNSALLLPYADCDWSGGYGHPHHPQKYPLHSPRWHEKIVHEKNGIVCWEGNIVRGKAIRPGNNRFSRTFWHKKNRRIFRIQMCVFRWVRWVVRCFLLIGGGGEWRVLREGGLRGRC